jgi:predicted nucleic acid-binding protein
MIVVDSSVWIDYFNGRPTAETEALDLLAGTQIIIGDLILAEVLQGFSSARAFRRAEAIFASRDYHSMVGREIAVAAARNYRLLRDRGLTVRNTIDTLIATFCIEEDHELLHADCDFYPFERVLSELQIRTAPSSATLVYVSCGPDSLSCKHLTGWTAKNRG